MGTYVVHKKETKDLVLKMFEETDLSAKQIAEHINEKYKHIIDRHLTKNSVIGIKNRAGKCKPREYNSKPSKARTKTFLELLQNVFRGKKNTSYTKSLAFNEIKERKTLYQARLEKLTTLLR
ncbi:MAG: hypothetical protein VW518_00795 [Burkholderiaceae bacterium]